MKNILITGGTGSFGQEFAEFVIDAHPEVERIVIFSRDWVKQKEMADRLNDPRLRFFLGDIRDPERVKEVLRGCDTVIHAAAFKHVNLGEVNPQEILRTNIEGSSVLIRAAIEAKVSRFLALSSDKAVQPLNTYGKSKAMMESLVIQANALSSHSVGMYSCCRYGNVFGTRGSVIETWEKQYALAIPLTITDGESTRFFLTLPQACQFVWDSLLQMQGGEIFIPKIPAFRIGDLVESLYPGSEYKTIGSLPGEKKHENLIAPGEESFTFDLTTRFVVMPDVSTWGILEQSSPRIAEIDLPYMSERVCGTKKELVSWLLANGYL